MEIKSRILLSVLLYIGLILLGIPSAYAQADIPADKPVVRVAMFWLSTCGHCHYVIKEVLPPIQEHYGEQLEILLIELASQADVDRLYQIATELGLQKEEVGVPFMIIGDHVLIGSQQIPAELPGLIDMYLEEGGIDYPSYPALAVYLPQPEKPTQVSEPTATNPTEESQIADSISAARKEDIHESQPVEQEINISTNGFTLATIVLVGMVAGVAYATFAVTRSGKGGDTQRPRWIRWITPLLTLVGMGIAGYLAYVEILSVEAVCGPIGDCNAVQSSSYAKLFGILPVAVLGLIGYIAILIAWLLQELRSDSVAHYASLAIIAMTLFGTLFSIYLTYLEIFVIQAVCMWCISLAVLFMVLLLLNISPARRTLYSLGYGGQSF
jgi:uncharacterized membrane protein